MAHLQNASNLRTFSYVLSLISEVVVFVHEIAFKILCPNLTFLVLAQQTDRNR